MLTSFDEFFETGKFSLNSYSVDCGTKKDDEETIRPFLHIRANASLDMQKLSE